MAGRPIVIDRAQLEARAPRRKSWWQACDDEEFREEIEKLSTDDQESLISEINAALSATGNVMNDTNADADWRHRARRAQALIGSRRAMLAAHIRSRQNAVYAEQGAARKRIVEEVRAMTLEGDVQGALLRLLDWVEGFGQRARHGGGPGPARTDGKKEG